MPHPLLFAHMATTSVCIGFNNYFQIWSLDPRQGMTRGQLLHRVEGLGLGK